MARPRGQARLSRAQIFGAAAAEFADCGFDAAGVDRIAARARVNKAMIYYHFGSKRGLYVEVLRDMFHAVGARLRVVADGPGSPREKVDAWIAAVVAEAAAHPWIPPIMLRELAAGAPNLDKESVGMVNAVLAAVADIIKDGQKAGVFRPVDPLLAYFTVMAPVMFFFARQRALERRLTPGPGIAAPRGQEVFARHMQESAWRMLRKD